VALNDVFSTGSTKPETPARLHNRNVTAVLGPTNTGKTYLAIERMLGHESGIIGLPLRLLAREVFNKLVVRAGAENVALVTGEEKIVPKNARYFVCTVEALPNHTTCAFAAIDEIQLASDLDRGHIFTDRLLNLRGTQETLLLGAETMRPIVERLLPGVNIITRPRMSVLAYTGSKKLTRLPSRSAIVTFSAHEVYAIAELIRRQRGGAAVVLGSLSPRTRNKQVELYQNGDVDFLIATDAIGMGLNLDVDHVAFAADSKYDGFQFRKLNAAEIGQIAGRAGRHLRDGTFGVSHAVSPFSDELVDAIENHRFQPVKILQWRNRQLDFSTIDSLRSSLEVTPDAPGLTRAPPTEDWEALDRLSRDPEVAALTNRPDRVELLWNACRIPDYLNISPVQHSDLINHIFRFLARDGKIDENWFGKQVERADKPVGDIDTLAGRIAEIRTWTFVANRADWLEDAWTWQEATRAVEDRLSDALHDQLTQRFVDRRTSVLMRQLKEKTMLDAEITSSGDVLVEGHHVGQLSGFRFQADPSAEGVDAKAVRAAADKSLAEAISKKAVKASQSPNEDFALTADGSIRWRGEVIAKAVATEQMLHPRTLLLADEQLNGAPRDQIQARLDLWLDSHIKTLLKPLFDLTDAENLSGTARGVAFRLSEHQGIMARSAIADEIKALDQETRAGLRQLGVRFGAFHIFVPQLLKPAPSKLLVDLFALHKGEADLPGREEVPALSAAGRTSVPVEPTYLPEIYRLVGFKICGRRAVRIDILERLADLIRPLMAWKPGGAGDKPQGALDGPGFTVTVDMTSLLGCAGEDFSEVLKSLGYRMERREAEHAPIPQPQPESAAEPAEAGQTALGTAEGAESGQPAAPETAAEETTVAETATPDTAVAETAQPDAAPALDAQFDIAPSDIAPSDIAPAAVAPAEIAASDTTDEEAVPPHTTASDSNPSEPGPSAPGPSEPAPTGAGTSPAEDAPAVDADEANFIEVWRPKPRFHNDRGAAKRDSRQGQRQKSGQKQDSGSGGDRTGQKQGHKQGHNRGRNSDQKPGHKSTRKPAQGGRPPRPEKKIDPDSPFAALAALKQELKKKD
tara:strand:+ start:6009 stop:9263 length:3255 start_codon:yes stop_codon:yes gene_type:complete